jgi:hypothetical protein
VGDEADRLGVLAVKPSAEESMQQAVENALAADREAALRDVYAGVALGGFIAKGIMTTLAVEEAWYAADLMLVARRKGR